MTTQSMTTRENQIIEAALNKILRYGMARTTMNDVAQEAGISRQTLYASFASKEDLLRATIRHLAERNIADIKTACAKTGDLNKQLDAFILHTAIRGYELLHTSPDADDVVSGFGNACKQELRDASVRYCELVAEILQPHEANIKANGMSVQQLADFTQKSTLTIKHEATSRAHLEALASALKLMVLKMAG